jgi:hypothetical protein
MVSDGFSLKEMFFTDGSGKKTDAPKCGEPATFHIRCAAEKPIEGLKVTMIIREVFGEGQTVLTLSNNGGSLGLAAGESEIRASFPHFSLQPGLYSMKIGMTTDRLEHVAAIESFRFYMDRTDKIHQSLFFQPCDWQASQAVSGSIPRSDNAQGE